MNTRLLSVGTLAAVLAIATPSFASEDFVKSNSEVFSASTSAQSLGTVEAEKEFKSILSETNHPTEVAQYGGSGEEKTSGIYIGGNLGLFIPTYDDLDTGFGGGGYVGYQFNKNWGAEVDLVYLGTNSSIDDNTDVNAFGVTGNVRYSYDLGSNSKWSIYGTLGAGIANLSVTNDKANYDESEGLFTVQTKVGASYNFNPKLQAFGQLRYMYIADGDITLTDGGFFSPEVGVQYKF